MVAVVVKSTEHRDEISNLLATKQNRMNHLPFPTLPTPKSVLPPDPPLSVRCCHQHPHGHHGSTHKFPSHLSILPTSKFYNSASLVLLSCCPSSPSALSLCYFRPSEHLCWTIAIASHYFLSLLFPFPPVHWVPQVTFLNLSFD